ncbi:MAG: bifunctional ADP-dependent NAD(P)H-hydrate dehydratase/NAD(P)H-hydrate epimerase [Leptospiraceae bacterium]|nr:bifunctional ADP-dependent NAD(P)H-hydrate dehydratase/NAD(P)H-hydrate epimerase [Leptospiraceae bacterium]
MNGDDALLTYEESRQLDKKTMELGWTPTQLMGQAALSSLYRLQQYLQIQEANTLLLCGPGNNGGDGLALAWHLLSAGLPAHKLLVVQTAPARSQAAQFYESLIEKGSIPRQNAESFLDSPHMENPDMVVEALLGSGQDRILEGMLRMLCQRIARLQQRGAFVLSLDVPAGLLEDHPYDETSLFVPDEIHTYGPHRLACALSPELLKSTVFSHPIGFVPTKGYHSSWIRRDSRRLRLFEKSQDSHKYANGSAWILGGSPGMEGALLLSSRTFFASGGGILRALSSSPRLLEEPSILWAKSPEIDDRTSVIAVGPGTSGEEARSYLSNLASILPEIGDRSTHAEQPGSMPAQVPDEIHGKKPHRSDNVSTPFLVLDAAATVASLDFPSLQGSRTVLTPHPGEWKAMGGRVIKDASALLRALEFVQSRVGSYVLYKGPSSVLLDPFSEKALVFPWPNASLAVAGSGDCLVGILMTALSRTSDVAIAAKAAMELLHSCSQGSVHPLSSDFPSLIRVALKSGDGTESGPSTGYRPTVQKEGLH